MKKPIIIMVSNQKGGVGKTTTTLELCSLFGREFKTLGIDMDPQGDLTTYSGITKDPKKTIRQVLDAEQLIEEAAVPADGFDLIAGDKSLANAAQLYSKPDDIFLLSDAINIMMHGTEDTYDFIFIDSAPGRSPLLYMEYMACDYLIAPSECDDGSIKGLMNIGEDLRRYRDRFHINLKVLGIVLTKNEITNMHKIAYDDLISISSEVGGTPFKTKIRKSIRATEAKTAQQSIYDYDAASAISKDYLDLKNEILERIQKDQEEK